MTATAKDSRDFVHIDDVVAAQANLVFAIDGVEEYGDFGAAHFADGVDDVAQFDRSHGIAFHVFGREVAVDDLSVQIQLAVLHDESGDERLDVRPGVIRFVDDARKVDALVQQVADGEHGLVRGAAELEGSRVVDDAEVQAFGGVLADFFRVEQKVKEFACGTSLGVYEVLRAEVQRVADVVVDVAGLAGRLEAGGSVGADAFERRRVQEDGKVAWGVDVFVVDAVNFA